MTSSVSGSVPLPQSRAEVASAIQEHLSRLPLILSLLDGLRQPPFPAAGDSELRAGCERAVTAILSTLARLAPSSPSTKSSKEERAIIALIRSHKAHELLDPDQLARLDSFITRLLPT